MEHVGVREERHHLQWHRPIEAGVRGVLQPGRSEDDPGARVDLADLVRAPLLVSVVLRVVRWLCKPAVHFAAIGALLFTLVGAWGGPPTANERVRDPIVVSASQVEQLLERYTERTGLHATEQDARALVDREIDEDVLYRDALFRGLDRGDRGVQWRLIEKMTFLSDEPETNPRDLLGQAVGLALDREDQVVRRILIEKMRLALKRLVQTITYLHGRAQRDTQPRCDGLCPFSLAPHRGFNCADRLLTGCRPCRQY